MRRTVAMTVGSLRMRESYYTVLQLFHAEKHGQFIDPDRVDSAFGFTGSLSKEVERHGVEKSRSKSAGSSD